MPANAYALDRVTATVIVTTQVLENYGEPASPYWKSKGGCSYQLCQLEVEEADLTSDERRDLLAMQIRNGLYDLIAQAETRDSAMMIEMVRSIRVYRPEELHELQHSGDLEIERVISHDTYTQR